MSNTIKTTITANGTHLLCDASQLNDERNGEGGFGGTVLIKQTGTGTWKLQCSPDNGTTFFDLKDQNGDLFTGTDDDLKNFYLGKGSVGKPMGLYLNVTGASGLSIDAFVLGS